MTARQFDFIAGKPGNRLDLVLAERVPEVSRSRWQRLIKSGEVRVDGQVITKVAFEISGGERVIATIPAAKPSHIEPEEIPLDVLYEDERILVINKPAGMVVHPAAGHQSGTLVHAALAHAPDIKGVGGQRRPGVVHRLDKDTSGVILLAKDDLAHQFMQQQFKDRTVQKDYLALVDGLPPTVSGKIEAPIGRDPNHRKRMAIVTAEGGRQATTVFHSEESFREHSLLRLQPESGRTHQIRVHLAFLKCPVVGDRVYGRRKPSIPVDRQMLHAYTLRLRPPGGMSLKVFRAPLPDDFSEALVLLGADPEPYQS